MNSSDQIAPHSGQYHTEISPFQLLCAVVPVVLLLCIISDYVVSRLN